MQEGYRKVTFYHGWCKCCGYCSAFCPKKAIAVDSEGYPYLADSHACNECGLCQALCPEFAVYVPAYPKRRKGLTPTEGTAKAP